MNPHLMVLVAAVALGVCIVPWNATLERMGVGAFFVVLGLAFVIVGGAEVLHHNPRGFPADGVMLAVATSIFYVASIRLFSWVIAAHIAVPQPALTLGVAAAILATYPVWAQLSEAAWYQRVPSPLSMVLMAMVILGIVGLATSGGSQ